MPVVNIGSQRYTVVTHEDPPDMANGACHQYLVSEVEHAPDIPRRQFAQVHFQHGPIKEHGVNGCHHEDLLAILIHRLQGLQSGPFPCPENARAGAYLREALAALHARTAGRTERGVEGTSAL